jgi:hypothetical protein
VPRAMGLLRRRPSTSTSVLLAAFSPKPRMLTTTPRPPSPMVSRICRPARPRSTPRPRSARRCLSMSSRVITLTAAGLYRARPARCARPLTTICSMPLCRSGVEAVLAPLSSASVISATVETLMVPPRIHGVMRDAIRGGRGEGAAIRLGTTHRRARRSIAVKHGRPVSGLVSGPCGPGSGAFPSDACCVCDSGCCAGPCSLTVAGAALGFAPDFPFHPASPPPRRRWRRRTPSATGAAP